MCTLPPQNSNVVSSGGSGIFQGGQPIILDNFPQKLHDIEIKIEPKGEGRPYRPLDPPLVSTWI